MIDLYAARRFVQLHGRLLDRRRLAHLLDGEPSAPVAAAVAAYANPDGGYAGLIDPDVRTLSSQPIAVLTARHACRTRNQRVDSPGSHAVTIFGCSGLVADRLLVAGGHGQPPRTSTCVQLCSEGPAEFRRRSW